MANITGEMSDENKARVTTRTGSVKLGSVPLVPPNGKVKINTVKRPKK